jgi:putative addiction module component (TIGR02574 family)
MTWLFAVDASACSKAYPSRMATVFEIKKLALDLPEHDRATLVADLLESLPPILSDEDNGLAEALRQNAELDADPNQAISFAELDSHIRSRRLPV